MCTVQGFISITVYGVAIVASLKFCHLTHNTGKEWTHFTAKNIIMFVNSLLWTTRTSQTIVLDETLVRPFTKVKEHASGAGRTEHMDVCARAQGHKLHHQNRRLSNSLRKQDRYKFCPKQIKAVFPSRTPPPSSSKRLHRGRSPPTV